MLGQYAARSKAYRVWINMGLRVLMAALVISALTTLIAPGTGRNDSSCRQILESVRRVCQSSLGADCRSLYVHTHMYKHMYTHICASTCTCTLPHHACPLVIFAFGCVFLHLLIGASHLQEREYDEILATLCRLFATKVRAMCYITERCTHT